MENSEKETSLEFLNHLT